MSSPGSARLRLGDLGGVRRASRAVGRRARSGGGDGVVGGVHDLGQLVEALTVRARDAHQLGDQAGRQPARRRRGRGRTRRVRSRRRRSRGRARGSGRASSSARFGVNPRLTSSLNRSCSGGSITSIIWRWIIRPISSDSASITPLRRRAEQLRLAADHADVGVAGDRPEARAVGLLVPVHRIVRPQPGVLLPRMLTAVRVVGGEVDDRCVEVRARHGRHRRQPPAATAHRAT